MYISKHEVKYDDIFSLKNNLNYYCDGSFSFYRNLRISPNNYQPLLKMTVKMPNRYRS